VRGRLYDTPDFERVTVWTVYEMTIAKEKLRYIGADFDAVHRK